jgi:hypothetical protein
MVGSTNHLDQLDPGLSKRPSRFDRKYLFPLPSQDERTQYCMFWRSRLAKKSSDIKFPKKLAAPMAEKMDQFSFAYMKEAFVATLLAIANNHTGEDPPSSAGDSISASLKRVKIENDGDEHGHDELHDYELWREFVIQVQILRDDMDNSETAVAKQPWGAIGGGYDFAGSNLNLREANVRRMMHLDEAFGGKGPDDEAMLGRKPKAGSQQKVVPQLEDDDATPLESDEWRPAQLRFNNEYTSTFFKDGSLTGDLK